MKVLVSAFVCDPYRGSEEGVGWGMVWALAKHHRVHVATTPRHRSAIEHFLRETPCENLTFSYHDFPKLFLKLIVTSALWQLYYYLWQQRIASWLRSISSDFDADVIHHITYGRYWAPCSLWKLNKPFIWGPLGGADNIPPSFYKEMCGKALLLERIRPLIQRIAAWDPSLRATAKHATVALASTPVTADALTRLGCQNVKQVLQMAVDDSLIAKEIQEPSLTPLFCSIGKLTYWKGQTLSLWAFYEAFFFAPVPNAKLVIFGDGPGRSRLENLARHCGIADRVEFRGNRPRAEVLSVLARATALLHPSLRDQAPSVVFEAMMLGVPVIAVDLAGPSIQLTRESGVLLQSINPALTVDQMKYELRRLVEEPNIRKEMGRKARDRVQKFFTWSHKAQQMDGIYREAITLWAQRSPVSANRPMEEFEKVAAK